MAVLKCAAILVLGDPCEKTALQRTVILCLRERIRLKMAVAARPEPAAKINQWFLPSAVDRAAPIAWSRWRCHLGATHFALLVTSVLLCAALLRRDPLVGGSHQRPAATRTTRGSSAADWGETLIQRVLLWA